MKVTVYRDVDTSTKAGLVTLLEAVKRGYQFRPVGQFEKQATVPATTPKRRRKKHKRAVYKIGQELGAKIVRLRKDGASYPSIAKTVGISASGVAGYLKRAK